MDVKEAYNRWSSQYDSNQNKTRDLEGMALRESLSSYNFNNCLEVGCGTGKNTVWLKDKAETILAVDLSDQMLEIAKQKIDSGNVKFLQADITKGWNFTDELFDLITFSLVLEHIEDLDHIFNEASKLLAQGGIIYIGELHPFKQYTGTKARFDDDNGRQVVECYNHNISDFTFAARRNSLSILEVKEFFDNDDKSSIPRILTLVFRKD
jgi:ubiquinone/menaquinone biosynthesis C-methylase UbiE